MLSTFSGGVEVEDQILYLVTFKHTLQAHVPGEQTHVFWDNGIQKERVTPINDIHNTRKSQKNTHRGKLDVWQAVPEIVQQMTAPFPPWRIGQTSSDLWGGGSHLSRQAAWAFLLEDVHDKVDCWRNDSEDLGLTIASANPPHRYIHKLKSICDSAMPAATPS